MQAHQKYIENFQEDLEEEIKKRVREKSNLVFPLFLIMVAT